MARNELTPMQRAAVIAARQKGLVTLGQSKAAGLSPDQVEYAETFDGWDRLARSLYALPGSAPSWRRDAMGGVLLGGDEAVASYLTAAALWDWCAPPLLPHVTVPPGNSTRTPLVRVHRSLILPVDRAVRDGIRCTSASRTLLDCAGVVERPRLEAFVDDALCAGVATPASVRAAADRAGRAGRTGVVTLDEVLDVWTEDIAPGSPAEVRMVRRLVGLGVSEVVTQHEVFDEAGDFVARLDAAIPERRLGFEYDSDRFHNPRHWARDEPRYARLRALGWQVEPMCKLDLLPSSTRLAELLERAGAARVFPDSAQKAG